MNIVMPVNPLPKNTDIAKSTANKPADNGFFAGFINQGQDKAQAIAKQLDNQEGNQHLLDLGQIDFKLLDLKLNNGQDLEQYLAGLEDNEEIMAAIISILEGYKLQLNQVENPNLAVPQDSVLYQLANANLDFNADFMQIEQNLNKDIEQFLSHLKQDNFAANGLSKEIITLLEEYMARMPQAEISVNQSPEKVTQQINNLEQLLGAIKSSLCPPENVNDTSGSFGQSQADADAQNGQLNSSNNPIIAFDQQLFDLSGQRISFATSLDGQLANLDFKPLTAENLFLDLVEQIKTPVQDNPTLEISLKPEHLGKLTVQLSMGENGVTARLLADDENVRHLLANHLGKLSEMLEEKGLKIENIEVAQHSTSDKPFNEQQYPQSRQGYNYQALLNQESIEMDSEYPLAYEVYGYQVPEHGLGLSSVEYKA